MNHRYKSMFPFRMHLCMLCLSIGAVSLQSQAQSLTPDFITAGYTLEDLGGITDLPTPYGGLNIKADEPNTLYIGGTANQATAAIYTVPLLRDAVTNSIIGFAGPAEHFVDAPNIDGGLEFTPEGTILFTRYMMNELGQILPDESYVSVPLSTFGIGTSVGSLAFVPAGYPGAGNFILSSYNSHVIYNVPYTVDANGFYALNTATVDVNIVSTAAGPEGIAYVPFGSAGFTNPSMIVSAYGLGKVVVFEVDANGLPINATARDMVTGLTGAEGAWIDPVTGDFLFSTFGGSNRVVRVSGFEQPTAVPDRPTSDAFTLYPNPTSGILQLAFSEAGGRAEVEVIDPRGAVVLQHTLDNGPLHTLDLGGHAAGLYSIRVVRDGMVRVERVVLE